MRRHQDTGFTIVEVTLFLAISSMLLLGIFAAVSGTLSTTRFSDSSRSLQSFLQKQYDDIVNGLNDRNAQQACSNGSVTVNPPSGQQAGASGCLLLGKLIVLPLNSSTLQVYDIIGTEPASPNYTESDSALIYDYQPTIVTNADTSSYTIPWSATIFGSKRSADSTAVDSIAFIRSPRSTQINTYTYKSPGGSYSLTSLVDPNSSTDTNNFNSTTNGSNFCLKSTGVFNGTSKIVLAGGQGQDAIGLSFTVGGSDCNGS